MPENRDSQYTTDQNRSGGFQTQEPEGTSELRSSSEQPQKPELTGQGIDGGYGKPSGQGQGQKQPGGQGTAAKQKESEEFIPEDAQAQYSEDDVDQGGRSDSKESQLEWSPGSDMPNT